MKMSIGGNEIVGCKSYDITGYLPKGDVMMVRSDGKEFKAHVWIDDDTKEMKLKEVDPQTEVTYDGIITIE